VTEELLGDCVLSEPFGGAVGVGSSVDVSSYFSPVCQDITSSRASAHELFPNVVSTSFNMERGGGLVQQKKKIDTELIT
jgi:hypothetical protein